MQDNYPNMNKKFTDKGWAAMRDLLDEEMPTGVPEERKRRRWIFFLLFFSIGLGIAVGVVAGGLYFMENDIDETRKAAIQKPIAKGNSVAIPTEKGKDKMASANAILVEKEANNLAKILNDASLSQKINIEKGVNLNSNSIKKTAKLNLKAGKFNSSFNEKSGIKSLNIIDENLTKSHILRNDDNTNVATNLEEEKAINSAEKANSIVLKGENGAFNYLAINNLEELEKTALIPDFDLNLPALEILDDEEEENKPKRKARFGVEVAGQGAPNFAGISGGLIYSLSLKNKSSLQTGLNYQYQRRTFSGSPISIETASQVVTNYPGLDDEVVLVAYSGNAARSDSAIFTIPQNLSSHYLNIPLWVNYQLSEKWSVGTGINLALLLFGSNNYTDGGILNDGADVFNTANDLSSGVPVNFENQKSINKANLRNFDFGATAGVAFHPSPKWSIAANYHHGFVNLFRYSSDKKYNRFANLSLQYHFGK
jgi:hypothetical protein